MSLEASRSGATRPSAKSSPGRFVLDVVRWLAEAGNRGAGLLFLALVILAVGTAIASLPEWARALCFALLGVAMGWVSASRFLMRVANARLSGVDPGVKELEIVQFELTVHIDGQGAQASRVVTRTIRALAKEGVVRHVDKCGLYTRPHKFKVIGADGGRIGDRFVSGPYQCTEVVFPQPVSAGETHTYTLRMEGYSNADPAPRYIRIVPTTPIESARVRVSFDVATRPVSPRRAVWMTQVPGVAPDELKYLSIGHDNGIESHFTDLEVGCAYGVEWD